MAEPKAVVLRTAGTNCDYETVHALKLAGFKAETRHVNELICGEKKLSDYQLLVLPGGFSHGDYLGSGKILAVKLAVKLKDQLADFINSGNLVLGICNGFQTLVKAGILPGFNGNYSEQLTTLTFNDSGHFQDEWITMKNANKGKCIFTKGIETIFCPINHGEGKFIPSGKEVLQRLYDNDQIVFKYKGKNPNGSVDDVAGICDETGRVMGLMPHPEKNFTSMNNPLSTRIEMPEEGEGLKIFRNAFDYARKLV